MTYLVDSKYRILLDSINGINIEISRRRNYINMVRGKVMHNHYYPKMITAALSANKELTKLRIIRNELWILIMNMEIKDLRESI